MLLGSTEYDDDSEDDDFEYDTTQTHQEKRRISSDEIKREARLMNKISGDESRKRITTKYQNKKIKAQKRKKLMDEMNKIVTPKAQKRKKLMDEMNKIVTPNVKKIRNSTSVVSLSTPSSSISANSSPTVTTSNLCGYQVNPIESSHEKVDTVQNTTLKQPDLSSVVCRGCNLNRTKCPNLMYGGFCHQRCIDFYNKVGFAFTDEQVKQVHNDAFKEAVQRDMCLFHGRYEMNPRDIQIPKCVEYGSLKSSLEMMRGHRSFVKYNNERVYNGCSVLDVDVKEEVKNLKSG